MKIIASNKHYQLIMPKSVYQRAMHLGKCKQVYILSLQCTGWSECLRPHWTHQHP